MPERCERTPCAQSLYGICTRGREEFRRGEGAAGLGGSIASGTCGRSISEIPYDFGYDSERFRREWD